MNLVLLSSVSPSTGPSSITEKFQPCRLNRARVVEARPALWLFVMPPNAGQQVMEPGDWAEKGVQHYLLNPAHPHGPAGVLPKRESRYAPHGFTASGN